MKVSEVPFGGWARCVKLESDELELIVTIEVGPRVISARRAGAASVFKEYPEALGSSGSPDFVSYGGHRLWVAPEERFRTYAPDNVPVEVTHRDKAVTFHAPTESSGLQKEVSITIDGGEASLTHRIFNRADSTQTFAAWCLSVMRAGGVAVAPLPRRVSHAEDLLPTGSVILWGYTDLSDPRFAWGKEVLFVKQDTQCTSYQKIGLSDTAPWLAYVIDDSLFIKETLIFSGPYPDRGSLLEVFTDGEMLELETLSPLNEVPPGGFIEHREEWSILPVTPAMGGHYFEREAELVRQIKERISL